MTATDKQHHWRGGFRNPPGSPPQGAHFKDMLGLMWEMATASKPVVPTSHVATEAERARQAKLPEPSVTWLGHAAFLLRLGGLGVLTDPFLSEVAGPAGLGPRRFVAPALTAEQLPQAQVMIVSHNHYDHLDTTALKAYPHKAGIQVIVPLGLGRMFRKFGYAQVQELDWWESMTIEALKVTALPAIHFSGRGIFDRNRTLWASFAIEAAGKKVWFGGDTALGPVFEEIGRRAGPFDLALVPIGAYAPRSIMQAVHANPEEAVAIAQAIRAKRALGMHWGTIRLTTEDPFEPPRRFLAAANASFGENAWIFKIGETRSFTD